MSLRDRLYLAGAAFVVLALVALFSDQAGWFLGEFIHGPSGYALLSQLVHLAIAVVLIGLFVWWFNRTSVTGEKLEIHAALDRIFDDANALSRFLGLLCVALAIFASAIVR